jgi:hypothetical protein
MHGSNDRRFINSPPPLVVQHRHNRVQGNNSVLEKPHETWLKCNVDVVFHDRNHITSFVCCVRDSPGQFIRGQKKWQQANMTVFVGEAVALLDPFTLLMGTDGTELSLSPTQLL